VACPNRSLSSISRRTREITRAIIVEKAKKRSRSVVRSLEHWMQDRSPGIDRIAESFVSDIRTATRYAYSDESSWSSSIAAIPRRFAASVATKRAESMNRRIVESAATRDRTGELEETSSQGIAAAESDSDIRIVVALTAKSRESR